jgi:hypothetical protein
MLRDMLKAGKVHEAPHVIIAMPNKEGVHLEE